MKILALLLSATTVLAQQNPPAQRPPVFSDRVDIVRADVQVVTADGDPIADLVASDFEVAIDGRARRVVSADLIRFETDPAPAGPIRTPGQLPADARVFVLAIDQMGFTTGGIQPLRGAIQRFVDQLRPEDMVAVYPFPFHGRGLDLTHDHQSILPTVKQLVGLRNTRMGVFSLTPSEIIEITDNRQDTLDRVVSRECDSDDTSCPSAVRGEASSLGSYLEGEAAQRIGGLRLLAAALARIPGRKTVVLVSGSLISGPATRGRPDVSGLLRLLGEQLSAAEISLYTLHWDTSFLDAFSASQPSSFRAGDRTLSLGADRQALAIGLELVTGAAGGALLRVEAGSGDNAFGRVLRETQAIYLLGVELTPEDRDGKAHVIRVRVNRGGATVRGRTHVVIPDGDEMSACVRLPPALGCF